MTQSQDDNTSQPPSKSSKKSGDWFRFDVDFEDDPRIIQLLITHRSWGLGLYIRLVALMYKHDGDLDISTPEKLKALIYILRDRRLPSLILTLSELGLIYPTSGSEVDHKSTTSGSQVHHKYRSGRVDLELSLRNKLSDKARDNVSKRKDRQPDLQPYNGGNTTVLPLQDITLQDIKKETNAPPEQIPAPLTLGASSPPKQRTKKIKPKLNNLIESTEEELIAKGLDPSKPAPKNLTRKKESLIPQDSDSRVWMTNAEAQKLIGNWGPEKVYQLFNNLSEYLGMKPEKAAEYADHYLTILNWEKRNANK